MNRTDLDHVLGVFDFFDEVIDEETKRETPLSEIFKIGLDTELEFAGLYSIPYDKIILSLE